MPTTATRPWHLNLIGALALLWFAGGAVEYLLLRFAPDLLAQWVPPVMIVLAREMPFWADLSWAVGVWIGLLGAMLLWMRDSSAVIFFAVSFLGCAGVLAWFLGDGGGPLMAAVTDPIAWLLAAAAGVGFLLWLYARELKTHGHLGR